MTYSVLEASQYAGKPVECYLFSYGDTAITAIAASDKEVELDSTIYAPGYIRRDNITNTQDAYKITLNVYVTKTSPVVERFKVWMDDKVFLTIRKVHYGDTDSVYLFKGRVVDCIIKGDEAELLCESSFSIMTRNGITRRFSIGCPHTLYDAYTCKVLEDSVRQVGNIKEISGNDITVDAIGDYEIDYFTGGMIQMSLAVPFQYRTILKHVKTSVTEGVFTVDNVPPGAIVGATIYLLPGCAKTQIDCLGKFGNQVNFGGLPIIPTRNPFVTQSNLPPER